MTQLLEQAYARIARLPPSEQDTIASLILEQLEDEEQWTQQFAKSADVLAALAQKALKEHRVGNTLPLDPETL